MVSAGRNGTPIAAGAEAQAERRGGSTPPARPRPTPRSGGGSSTRPRASPIDIHAVTTRLAAPAAMKSSPSLHMRFRESVSPRRRCRRISRMSARGVREKRQPPTPIWSPSLTRAAASSTRRQLLARPTWPWPRGGGGPRRNRTRRGLHARISQLRPGSGRARAASSIHRMLSLGDLDVLGLAAERGREVALTRVVDHRHDRRQLRTMPRQLERGRDVASGGDAAEDAFLGGEPPRHRHALVGGRP